MNIEHLRSNKPLNKKRELIKNGYDTKKSEIVIVLLLFLDWSLWISLNYQGSEKDWIEAIVRKLANQE